MGKQFECVNNHIKFLGIHITSDLTWSMNTAHLTPVTESFRGLFQAKANLMDGEAAPFSGIVSTVVCPSKPVQAQILWREARKRRNKREVKGGKREKEGRGEVNWNTFSEEYRRTYRSSLISCLIQCNCLYKDCEGYRECEQRKTARL
ncbi:hypothetical protein L3Q82_007969 [Scortum barcoo]|uniref:Uncharacterized protein n=1 Tax=Scortum barcoo TaxID=214431 RepID=A0ACB8WKG4_9TELE|nr:hypothetical protein L3Q82_007969 [Scortum barcoo]